MTHPTHEDWMDLLYSEAEPSRRRVLEEHLAHCEVCSEKFDRWRGAAGYLTSTFPPAPRRRPSPQAGAMRWAAAAAIVFMLGMAGGWIARAQWGARELQALRQEFGTALSRESAVIRAEARQLDRRVLEAAVHELDERMAERLSQVQSQLVAAAWEARDGFQAAGETLAHFASLAAERVPSTPEIDQH
ncbi:MAG: hypothetical protein FJ405_08150 [Verrucomicrobia bacterium]|nr:hypothetical protein [Verrucomicrobiota bacterium]